MKPSNRPITQCLPEREERERIELVHPAGLTLAAVVQACMQAQQSQNSTMNEMVIDYEEEGTQDQPKKFVLGCHSARGLQMLLHK